MGFNSGFKGLIVAVCRHTKHTLSFHRKSNARNHSTWTSVHPVYYFMLHISVNRFLVQSLTEICRINWKYTSSGFVIAWTGLLVTDW